MPAPSRGRRGRRIGLALAGGGPEGAVYEIGALRALEEAVDGLDLNACAVYVGVSAGAFIAASLANGLTSRQLVRGLVSDDPDDAPFDPSGLFTPAYRDWARRGSRLPRLLGELLVAFTRAPGDHSVLDALARLARALPLGLFDNEPIRRTLAGAFRARGRSDDFRRLARQLFVVASDLEAGVPVVFGTPGWDRVPISVAVQASSALPGLYPPVEVNGRLLVDGVLLRTVHASVALEHGADLLFCVNPVVPVDVAAGEASGVLRAGSIRRGGLPALMSQTFRTLIHSRMVVGMARYRTHFPDADVVLFEPAREEYRLFFSNAFSFASRRDVCEIGYRATRADLWRRRRRLGPMLRARGLGLRLDVLRDRDRTVWEGAGLGSRGRPRRITEQLGAVLAELERGA